MNNPIERIGSGGLETQVNQVPSTGLTADPLADMPFLHGRISRRSLFKGAAVLVAGALALRPELSEAQEQPFNYQFKWVVNETDPAKKGVFLQELQKADGMLSAYTETAARIGDPLAGRVKQFGDLVRARVLNPGQKPERSLVLYLVPSYKNDQIPERTRNDPIVYELAVSEKLGIIGHRIFVHSAALDLDINTPNKIDPLLAIAEMIERVDLGEKYLTERLELEPDTSLVLLKQDVENIEFNNRIGLTAKPRVLQIYQQAYPSLASLGVSPSRSFPGPSIVEEKPPIAQEEPSE